MAKSGQVNTNTVYDSYFWVKWEQSGNQDVPNNKTQIKWSCGVYCGHNFYSNAIRMSGVTINGSLVYGGGTYSNFYEGNHTIASGSMWVSHESDGKKSFTISSFTGWLYNNNNYSSGGETFSLEPIPRQALITSVSDFTDVDNPSFTFSNPGGFSMQAWLEPNPVGDHLCERALSGTSGTCTWELTDAEREALRSKCKGLICPIRVGLYTNVNGTTYHDFKDKTFTMTENEATKPVVSLNVALNNGSLPSKFAGMYIQGKSRLQVDISAQGKYSADILSRYATIGGVVYNSYSFLSNVLSKSGTVDVIGYAKDSRQFTGSKKQQITVVEYSKPLVIPLGSEAAILCYRSDGNGKRIGNSTSLWIKAKRSYHSLSNKNQCALQWRRKLVNDAWDSGNEEHKWHDLISKTTTTTNEYNALLADVVFEKTKSYTVQIMAIDDIGESDVKTFEIPTEDVALHLGKGGKNVSIGTYCDYSESYTFYSKWKAIFDKGVYIGENKYPINDFVIEQGIDGIWAYEKWASGIAKCRGKIPISNLAITIANGSMYRSAGVVYSANNFPYPFAFAELPCVSANFIPTDDNGAWVWWVNGGTKKTVLPDCYLFRPSAITTGVSGYIDITVSGKWK